MKQMNNWIKAIAIIAFLALPFNQISAQTQRAGQSGAAQLLNCN